MMTLSKAKYCLIHINFIVFLLRLMIILNKYPISNSTKKIITAELRAIVFCDYVVLVKEHLLVVGRQYYIKYRKIGIICWTFQAPIFYCEFFPGTYLLTIFILIIISREIYKAIFIFICFVYFYYFFKNVVQSILIIFTSNSSL